MTPEAKFDLGWQKMYEAGLVHPDEKETCRAFFMAGYGEGYDTRSLEVHRDKPHVPAA